MHHGWDECTPIHAVNTENERDRRRNEPSAALSRDLSESSAAQHQNSEVWLMTVCFQCITADVRAAEFTFAALLPNEVPA